MKNEKQTHRVGFKITAYDRACPLVIDPVLVYSTCLGGSSDDYGQGIAVDAIGSCYVTGYTESTNSRPAGRSPIPEKRFLISDV